MALPKSRASPLAPRMPSERWLGSTLKRPALLIYAHALVVAAALALALLTLVPSLG